MDYQVGQGVKFERKPGYTGYGVVCGGSDNWVGVLQVKPLDRYTHSYDDVGAKKSEKDNVRLKDCPPPFTRLCREEPRGVYALTGQADVMMFSVSDCINCKMELVDKGERISKNDWKRICNHPWVDEKEQEKIHSRRVQAVKGIVENINQNKTNEDDYEYQ